MNIQYHVDIPSTCGFLTMTMIHDALNRPYLYVANKEAGLRIYDIRIISSPQLVATIPTIRFDTLDVMNVSQSGNYLYLAIGNSFTNIFIPPQPGGMAIVDVTDPVHPFVTDYYVVPSSVTGAGIVKVENNTAYLGAMRNGLVILDVTNKNDIQFVRQLVPSINYPPVPNPVPGHYLARGMEVKNGIVYLCYDAGGLRIINCTDRLAPRETGRYANPALYIPFDLTRGYNNLVVDDSLAYIAVDYCGLEVLNISDTSHIVLRGWWNPYRCPSNDWYSSPVHATEIQYNKTCKQVFLSTGKSDMHVINVADPTHPDSCNSYGGVSNDIGSWGMGLYQNQIYVAYICTLGIPFPSNWTGIKILTYTPCNSTGFRDRDSRPTRYSLSNNYPNPFNPQTDIEYEVADKELVSLKVFSMLGQEMVTLVHEVKAPGNYRVRLDAGDLPSGVYWYRMQAGSFTATKKLVLLR
jgi:hypothetical protein